MSQPFKFRYVNEITGAFVLGAMLLLVVAVFLAGRVQGIFEPKFRLYIDFTTEEGSFGLQKGSDVRVRDYVAGTIASIVPSTNGILRATLVIKESFHPFVHVDSKAIVKKALILTGDAYLYITSGAMHKPLLPDGSFIPCFKDTEIIEQAKQLIDDLRTNTIPVLKQFRVVLDEVAPLAVQSRKTMCAGENVLRDNVPAVLMQAQETLRSAQVTLEALQRTWLLRSHVEEPDNTAIIPPGSVDFREAERTNTEDRK
jgi:ABC-type transporter Mla subunit MlaD